MTEDTTQTAQPETIEDDPVQVRKNKRAALIEAGEEPYARRFDYDIHVADIEERYAFLADGEEDPEGHVWHVAGRVMAIRDQGKLAFLGLRDATGDIQLFIRVNVIGEEGFARVKDLDIGDWIGVTGVVCRTRRGQLSIAPSAVELLTKSLRPLPEKFHGLQDKELRYRMRYVDLVMNPEVKDVFEKRSRIVTAVRHAAEDLGFLEVETPMLHPIPGGATARPFVTHHNALDREFYLRVAPELNLKRLLVGGFEKVFEVNRCFRNEGMDIKHNPEFTTIEAYQAYTDINGMMDFAKHVIQAACLAANDTLQITYQGHEIDLENGWRAVDMCDLVSEACGREVGFDMTEDELEALCKQHGITRQKGWGKGKMIAELYDELCEASIVQPTFVCKHPTEVSPLAKKNRENPLVTDRFELIICGAEYGNAFSELNDPVDQAERFQAQVAAKDLGDDEAMGFDSDYIRALEYGMPPAGGIGIGIDRLVMLLTDSVSIRDVLLFPHMRDER